MPKPPTPEPLATLKTTYNWLRKPLRVDPAQNIAVFNLKGHRSLTARLRNLIAEMQASGGNGAQP
jgi:hypothetical protein